MEELKTSPAVITPQQKSDDLVPIFAVSLQEAKQRFVELAEFVKDQMVPGEDFGTIPGCQKPSLFKPGAEKLASIYGLSPRIELVDKIKDWERGFFHYQVKCSLISKRTGFIVAEGVGSCNSRESRYKKQDAYTLDNTILKMAKKRALIDAVLTATRTSGLFTQDVEDIVDEKGEVPAAETTWSQEEPAAKEHKPAAPKAGDPLCSEKQQKCIYAISKSLGMSDEAIKEMLFNDFAVEHTRELTMKQASSLIDTLQKQK